MMLPYQSSLLWASVSEVSEWMLCYLSYLYDYCVTLYPWADLWSRQSGWKPSFMSCIYLLYVRDRYVDLTIRFRLYLSKGEKGVDDDTNTLFFHGSYRQISIISRTKSPNLNVTPLFLQLPLPDPFKPGVKSRMKLLLEQRRQVMLQLHLSDRQFYCLLRCDLYIRGLKVCILLDKTQHIADTGALLTSSPFY